MDSLVDQVFASDEHFRFHGIAEPIDQLRLLVCLIVDSVLDLTDQESARVEAKVRRDDFYKQEKRVG